MNATTTPALETLVLVVTFKGMKCRLHAAGCAAIPARNTRKVESFRGAMLERALRSVGETGDKAPRCACCK